MTQLIILAAIAVFLILRLRSVLGTRTGFEGPPDRVTQTPPTNGAEERPIEVIEGGGTDQDIADHVDVESDSGKALAAMKRIEPDSFVSDFVSGSRQAYERILMAYESGDLETLREVLAPDVYAGFEAAVEQRDEKGLTVDARFIGVREMKLKEARFDDLDNVADITVRFVGELTSVVRDVEGDVVEGDPSEIKRQADVWTFSRVMGSENPNWLLVATGQ